MKVCMDTVAGACGMGVAYDFGYGTPVNKVTNSGGIGYICAGFRTNNKQDMEVFSDMEKRGPCVYRTPSLTNLNSKNEFFFAVFDWTADDKWGFNAQDGYDHDEDDDDF